MLHWIWIIINTLIVFLSIFYIWLFEAHDNPPIVLGQFMAQIGFLLFIFNVNMYFVFLVIRKTPQRKIKIFLAKISRKMMKAHAAVGITGLVVIIGHAIVMFWQLGPVVGYVSMKFISAYLALLLLMFTLISGFLRHFKASGFRRKFHLITAFIFLGAFLLHMFI